MPIVKTDAGQQVLRERSLPLTQRQRSALILFDGKKTVADVLTATAGLGVTRADVDHLFAQGLLADQQPAAEGGPAAADRETGGAAGSTPQERYAAAYPVAIRLTSALGLRGFRLNLAVEAARSYEDLVAVAPRIREAVGADRFRALQDALGA